MKNIIKAIWIIIFVTSIFIISCKGNGKKGSDVKGGIDENSLGLRKTSVFDEQNTKTPGVEYSKQGPGSSKRFGRSYENAPPQIPHSVSGLLPITQKENRCLGCHIPAVAKSMKATPLPKSHFYDMRYKKELAPKDLIKAQAENISNTRYECVLCHVPQATNVKPLANTFKPVFRSEKSKNSSNLMDVLNEGVKEKK